MTTNVVCRILVVFSRSISQFELVGHETQSPSFNSCGGWTLALEDAKLRLVICVNDTACSIQMEMEMLYAPDNCEHFAFRLRVSAFNVDESTACVAYHFPTSCEDEAKTKGAGISKHFREHVWVEVCHRIGVRQSIC